jgi:hypothetical protein
MVDGVQHRREDVLVHGGQVVHFAACFELGVNARDLKDYSDAFEQSGILQGLESPVNKKTI